MKKLLSLILIALLSSGSLIAQDIEQESDENKSTGWTFNVTPYIWLAGFKADVVYNETISTQVVADFSDILQNLNMAAMLHAEAQNGRWILMGDLLYFKASKDGNLELVATPTELEVTELITELGLGYNFVNNEGAFLVDGLAGWRHIGMDNVMTIGMTEVIDRHNAMNDPYFGARFRIKSEKWMFNMRGDLGGFGVGSQLSWKVNLLGAYKFSDLFSLYFGVQALGIDYEKNDFNIDIMTTGLGFGGNFTF